MNPMPERALLENRVILAVLDGDSPRQIAERTGLDPAEVFQLIATYKLRATCEQPRCGQQQEGAGRPRRGWVQIRHSGRRPWFCSLHCASLWLQRQLP